MLKSRRWFWVIMLVTALAVFIDLPKYQLKIERGPIRVDHKLGQDFLDFSLFGLRLHRENQIQLGLDLQGGLSVTLQANMESIAPADRDDALESAQQVIARRVNFYGVTEPNIYTSQVGNDYRIKVELPGVADSQKAIDLIGQTAQLEFREEQSQPAAEASPPEQEPFLPTNLTGKDLRRALVQFDPKTNAPVIALTFTDEGAKKFAEITARNVGKPLAIYLDNQIITAPRVSEAISGGQAVISGQFTTEEAKQLAIQLNAGALPVPIKILEQTNIGPTLGRESITRSLRAGLVGLLLVAVFMILYYGRLGILATLALIIYGLITLALYKLIPVTMTLAGMAGFILSIGMAVDSNILIFERMKEEIRAEKPLKAAMELGFGRAWDSIRDANVATLITVFILFNPFNWSFLVTSGMVRGFALTLGLGILISLFTGVIVTRTLVRVFYR